ncbi:PAAR domain-containing protein [Paraburkholderia sp. 2C]
MLVVRFQYGLDVLGIETKRLGTSNGNPNQKSQSSNAIPDNPTHLLNMTCPIRQGDTLESGGEVTGGSPFMVFMNRSLARQGDAATCALHGPTTISEGHERFPDRDGKLVAMHQHRCACGCRLISSLLNVSIA